MVTTFTYKPSLVSIDAHYCALAVAQCIVIGPVCEWVSYHDNSKLRASILTKLITFWPSCTPGKGSVAGLNFLAPPYYSIASK